jgi:hypothetical protein
MNRRSAEWSIAVTAYLPTRHFLVGDLFHSLPDVCRFSLQSFRPAAVPCATPDIARSQLIKLAIYSLVLGILGSLAIMLSLEISGKYAKATRFSDNTIHSTTGFGKTLSRLLPIVLGLGMGIAQANALNAPWCARAHAGRAI